VRLDILKSLLKDCLRRLAVDLGGNEQRPVIPKEAKARELAADGNLISQDQNRAIALEILDAKAMQPRVGPEPLQMVPGRNWRGNAKHREPVAAAPRPA
jgi:hypothetical protein